MIFVLYYYGKHVMVVEIELKQLNQNLLIAIVREVRLLERLCNDRLSSLGHGLRMNML